MRLPRVNSMLPGRSTSRSVNLSGLRRSENLELFAAGSSLYPAAALYRLLARSLFPVRGDRDDESDCHIVPLCAVVAIVGSNYVNYHSGRRTVSRIGSIQNESRAAGHSRKVGKVLWVRAWIV